LKKVTFVNTEQSHIENNKIIGNGTAIFMDAQSHDNRVALNNLSENKVDLNNAKRLDSNTNSNEFQNNVCTITFLMIYVTSHGLHKVLNRVLYRCFRLIDLIIFFSRSISIESK
jgi:hypothetical protein